MAIAYDNAGQSGAVTGSSASFSFTVGSGSNRLLVVSIVSRATTDANRVVTAVTYNSVALTKAVTVNDNTYKLTADIWYLAAPTSGANTVAVTWAGSIDTRANVMAVSYTGAAQASLVDVTATNKNPGAEANATCAITTLTDNAWVVDALFHKFDPVTAHTPQVTRNVALVGDTLGQSDRGPITPAGSLTMQWDSAAVDNWVYCVMAFKPSTGSTATSRLALLGVG